MKRAGLLLILLLFAVFSFARAEPAELVVHEWGTFTSFSGSDGTYLEFRTHVGEDLPPFVYTRSELEKLPVNTAPPKFTASLQRMETPVTYFYVNEPMTVDVTVEFPDGLLTEVYPRTREHGPPVASGRRDGGVFKWGRIRLFPPNSPKMAGVELPWANRDLEGTPVGDHYFHARDVKSAFVRVCPELEGLQLKTEIEKFLFYRGLGNFTLPLDARVKEKGSVRLSARPWGLDWGIVLEVSDDGTRARTAFVRAIEAWEVSVPLGPFRPVEKVAEEVRRRLRTELTNLGLFDDEAIAFIKTWERSYFETPGLRVLYPLPRHDTDRVLPLKVTPRPKETVRVMIGRAEVLTPERKQRVEAIIERLGAPSVQERKEAQAELERLGRFALPVLERIQETTEDPEIRVRVERLIEAFEKPNSDGSSS